MKNIYFIILTGIILLTKCSTPVEQQDPIPEHSSLTIQSKLLNEDRVINIWVPENYNSTQDSFPVMYMPDGGIKEDFPHVANTLAKLIAEQKIKPIILVGIENTQRRRDLSGFTEVEKDKEIAPVVGGSEKFRSFIQEELFPEISTHYRTTNEKSILGESLAGLFVMETLFLKPEMFNNYIAFDPSLWWNNQQLVKSANEQLTKLPLSGKRIWFAGSDAADINVNTRELASIFETQKVNNLKWKYTDEPQEKHNTIFRATKEKALIWTLNDTE